MTILFRNSSLLTYPAIAKVQFRSETTVVCAVFSDNHPVTPTVLLVAPLEAIAAWWQEDAQPPYEQTPYSRPAIRYANQPESTQT
jgi:hypothetical protein